MSLAADAKTLAIGSPTSSARRGLVQVYQWVEHASTWEPLGQSFFGEEGDDEFGSAVALLAGGGSVAIGAPYVTRNGKWAGNARVFNLQMESCTTKDPCEEGQFCNAVFNSTGFCETCPVTKKCADMGFPEAGVADCVNLCEVFLEVFSI